MDIPVPSRSADHEGVTEADNGVELRHRASDGRAASADHAGWRLHVHVRQEPGGHTGQYLEQGSRTASAG